MGRVRSGGRLWRLVAILFVFSLIAAACGDDDDDGATGGDGSAASTEDGEGGDGTGSSEDGQDSDDGAADGEAPEEGAPSPTPGGSATFLMFSEINSLDPLQLTNSAGADGNRSVAIYGSLLRLNNSTGEIEPFMAESLTPNDDFSVWTLVLRPGLVFTDGEPFDAEAVKYNWERLRDTSGSVQANRMRNLAELNVIDDVTLEVVMEEPDASFDSGVARRLFAIGSPKAIEERGEGFATNPVGAGPFMLQEWVRDDRMVVVKNPDFFLADEGMPYLDELIMRPITDEDQRFNTFNQGEADLIYSQQPATIGRVVNGGYGIFELLSEGGENVNFNVTRPPFDDERVRRAFMMSVDLETMNDILLGGGGFPARGMFNEGHPYFIDVDWPTFDCAAAEELWAEVAADIGGPVEFTLGAFQGPNADIAEFMQASIAQCGGGNVRVEVEVNESGTAIGMNFNNDFDAHLWGVQFFFDPLAGITSSLTCDSPQNATRWCSEEFEALLAEARTLPQTERIDVYARMQEVLAEENPIFWFTRSLITTGFQDHIGGVELFEDGLLKAEQVWRRS